MSRRVTSWLRRLDDPDFALAVEERRQFEADHISMVVDDVRARGIELLFREQYEHIAPPLAERHGLDQVPVEQIKVKYSYQLHKAHADTLRLPRGARIRFSSDMVNVLFAWIRNVCSTLGSQEAGPVPEHVVVSRVAKALDLATAPMFWTRQYWDANSYHSGVAESFAQTAERFVLAHEIAHIYLPDQVLAARVPGWAAMPRLERDHRREVVADEIGADGLLSFARRFALQEVQPVADTLAHGVAGILLALAALDLLERYDSAYVSPHYPRIAIRRSEVRPIIGVLEHRQAADVEALEITADRIAGRALTMALRRRWRAAGAMSALLDGADGTGSWSVEELGHAMRAVVRHSRKGSLDTLAAAIKARPDERAVGFVRRFIVGWHAEPVYLPFLTDIEWERLS
ncbi:hypothetical protein ACTMTF_41640 [Nonomuraea sp. ZG12]|uniref:hypothetical protein n=1 Tax=Nonomuraea sp. ZG12 TaxID=3452207 RepID=UPI003F8A80C5